MALALVAVVAVGSLFELAGVELVGVLDVLDGDTSPFAVEVGSVLVAGTEVVFGGGVTWL